MRVFLLAPLLLAQASQAAPADVAGEGPPPAVERPAAPGKPECRKPASHDADARSAWRGEPVKPRKLAELPPAVSYMAVYRMVNGCEVPMTVTEYRSFAR